MRRNAVNVFRCDWRHAFSQTACRSTFIPRSKRKVSSVLERAAEFLGEAETQIRSAHPVVSVTGDRKLAQLMVLLMDQAKYALSLSGNDPRLGLQEAAIRPYVDQNTGEIAALRDVVDPKLTIRRLP